MTKQGESPSQEHTDAERAYDEALEHVSNFGIEIAERDVVWKNSYVKEGEFFTAVDEGSLSVVDAAYVSFLTGVDLVVVKRVRENMELVGWSIEEGELHPVLHVGVESLILTPLVVSQLEAGLGATHVPVVKEKFFTVDKTKSYFERHKIFSAVTGVFVLLVVLSLVYGFFFVSTA